MENWASKKTRRRRALEILAVVVIYIFIAAALIALTFVEAQGKQPEGPQITSLVKEKKPHGIFRDQDGHTYILKHGVMQFGWVRWKGATYYCHKTESKKYPKGSATRGEMRIKGGRFFAFAGADCKQITKDYYYQYGPVSRRLSLKINRDGSVRYVYNTARIHRNWRYSTAERRLQICGSDDVWRSTGMQYWPDYMDWQP